MPAAPGATPRKMLPPPITVAISTPRRATWAISATMPSMVWRLMPNGSSPIRASPESLSRTRLYFGVTAIPFSVDGFRDALADHQEGVGVDSRFLRAQQLLYRLLVVLDERLAEQRDLAEEFVERALDHPGDDVRRFSGFFCPRFVNSSFLYK